MKRLRAGLRDDPADWGSLSGIEFLRRVVAAEGDSASTFAGILGMRLTAVDVGTVEFSLVTRPEFANPLGTLHGGIAATMLDSALGCAVQSTLDAFDWHTTIELKVNYIRSPRLDGQTLRATGYALHVGRSTATAEGRVYDDQDRLIAHGTTTCFVRRA
jgi:uncharacterized protein (TIGR00369 family)